MRPGSVDEVEEVIELRPTAVIAGCLVVLGTMIAAAVLTRDSGYVVADLSHDARSALLALVVVLLAVLARPRLGRTSATALAPAQLALTSLTRVVSAHEEAQSTTATRGAGRATVDLVEDDSGADAILRLTFVRDAGLLSYRYDSLCREDYTSDHDVHVLWTGERSLEVALPTTSPTTSEVTVHDHSLEISGGLWRAC